MLPASSVVRFVGPVLSSCISFRHSSYHIAHGKRYLRVSCAIRIALVFFPRTSRSAIRIHFSRRSVPDIFRIVQTNRCEKSICRRDDERFVFLYLCSLHYRTPAARLAGQRDRSRGPPRGTNRFRTTRVYLSNRAAFVAERRRRLCPSSTSLHVPLRGLDITT